MNTIFLALLLATFLNCALMQFNLFHFTIQWSNNDEWNEIYVMMIREKKQCHWSKSIVLVNQCVRVCVSAPVRPLSPIVCFFFPFNSQFHFVCVCAEFTFHILMMYVSACALPCCAFSLYLCLLANFFPSMTWTWMNERMNEWQTT